jgi:hypothetical protein
VSPGGAARPLTIRAATPADVPITLAFIRELARYERLEHEVVATAAGVHAALFGPRPYAEVALDWNEPSIGFYRSLGAIAQDEWTTYRLDGAALGQLARSFG